MSIDIGSTASLSNTVTSQDIEKFAKVVGDNNPVHLDDEYAKTTVFKKRIAHGMLSAGLISAVIGTKLPGPGTIYLSQTLKFTAPVYIGDTITATVTVKTIRPDKGIITLDTICTNQHNKPVIEGEAIVMKKEQ
jgi:3-hydroxybutyryl-CoA dehydratase